MMSLFTASIAENLVSLRLLYILKCDGMVKVIEDEEEEKVVSGGQRTLLFPKLEELRLDSLPKLVSFCEWKCDVELPSLKKLRIIRCSNMRNFTLGFIAAPNLEKISTDLNHDVEVKGVNVSFDRLKELWIREIEYPFYYHKIFISLVNGLEELIISDYKGSMSLFTASMADSLVSLRLLHIFECDEMVKVIEDEEEKVVSGSQMTLLFPKLEELRLWGLLNLVSFCEWKCDVELPSLREVDIVGCPSMKQICLGTLTTPNLKTVNYEDVGATEDLNSTLQQQYLVRMKEKEEKEEKEEEANGEIEEVQN